MKIVNSGIALEAALQRRYMESLRDRVQARVEMEARLRHGASTGTFAMLARSSSQAAGVGGDGSAVDAEAGRRQLEREIAAQVDAELRAIGAVSGQQVDTQSPAVIGQRLARGELRFEPEVSGKERLRDLGRAIGRNFGLMHNPKMWKRDADRIRDLVSDTKTEVRVQDKNRIASDDTENTDDAGAVQRDPAQVEQSVKLLGQSDEQAQDIEVTLGEDPNAPAKARDVEDGNEIEVSVRQRLLSAGGKESPDVTSLADAQVPKSGVGEVEALAQEIATELAADGTPVWTEHADWGANLNRARATGAYHLSPAARG